MNEVNEQEIFENFLTESTEILACLEKEVIVLEQNPSGRETVDNIFRHMHSLKGNCSLFGISGIKLVAHSLENLMSKIRDREMEANSHVINIVLKGTDHLKIMFSHLLKERRESMLSPEQEEYVTEINSLLESGAEQRTTEALRMELLKFINQTDIKTELETNEPLKEMLALIRKTAPKLLTERRLSTGNPLLYRGMDVSREYFAVLGILAEVKTGNMQENQYSTVSQNLEYLAGKHAQMGHDEPVELLKSLLGDLEMLYNDESGFDEILSGLTEEAMAKYLPMLTVVKPEPPPKPAAENGLPPPSSAEAFRSRQIKIDQGKLDKTIDLAGEIVTVSEFFNYLQNQFAEGKVNKNMNSLKDAISSLQELSETLSRDLYDIRKVPISEAFQNLPRLVRDTAIVVEKKARLVIRGEETAVDKSIVSQLETILVHMIRNSIDHGIEAPSARRDAGKPEEGTVTLSAMPRGGMLEIVIADDGKGIDTDKLRQTVVKKGLFDAQTAAQLDEKQLIEQIFLPGFSMSEKVTETSGRGVGMDVVLSSIQELSGTVKVNNRPGQGLATTLVIPFTQTTLIKKGLAVAVGRSVFLIPIEAVIESFRPADDEIHTVGGKREIVKRRGEILTLMRLNEMFGCHSKITDPREGILVLVQNKRNRSCFMVDYVIGQRQIIYKHLSIKTKRQPSPFEGVSVYDGSRLAMILDIDGIIAQYQQ